MSTPSSATGPDFSAVDSLAKAQDLVRKGTLERVLMLPSEFGGKEIPQNVLFVPLGIGKAKAHVDLGIIKPLIASGSVRRYSATPEYQGNSAVPIAIRIVASDPGEFSTTINIWGDALQRG